MNHSDFYIGQTFITGTGRWLCTDIGSRVVVAVQQASGQAEVSKEAIKGPPYEVQEVVFDEYDFSGCVMEPGDIVPESILNLIDWRDTCTDRWGEDLYHSMLWWLGEEGLSRNEVPEEHRAALDEYRTFPYEKRVRLVRAALNQL